MITCNSFKKSLDFLDFLIQCYYKSAGSFNKQKLINFLFLKNPTQTDLNNFLSDWDIEVAGGNLSLFLAIYMKEHPEFAFPQYVRPRLEGLINYNRFKKIALYENFSKIVKVFNQNDIVPVATGDIALKCINADNNAEKINLIIKRTDFKKAKKIAMQIDEEVCIGKNCIKFNLKDNLSVNIFAKYDFDTRNKNVKNYIKYLFSRSTKTNMYNMQILMPSHEDIIYIELIEIAKIIKFNLSFENLLQSLTNIVYLCKKTKVNWQKIIDTARETKTGVQLKLSAMFIDEIISDLIPSELKDDNLFKQEITDYFYIARFKNNNKSITKDEMSLINQSKNILFKFKEIFKLISDLIITICLRYIFVKIIYNNIYLLRLYYKIKDKD